MRSITLSLSKGFATLLIVASATLAPAAVPAPELPVVNHYVYLSSLPKASELAQDAQANGLTVLRIDELPDRIIVSYQYPDGRTATLGYALLGSHGGPASEPSSVIRTPSPEAHSRVAPRDPEVIYVDRSYPSYPYYYGYPYYYWAPLTVGFGLGWATSYYGGHYYYHGGGHYHGGHGGGGHGGHGHGHR